MAAALDAQLAEIVERVAPRSEVTEMPEAYEIYVDRVRARFGAWYELFPRSFGGFRGVEEQLPRLRSSASTSSTCRRSTRSATRTARAATTRSWPAPTTRAARGRSATRPAATTRSTPSSGRSRTSTSSSRRPREHGIDIALDFAINASGDHPWLKEHPEWFNRRPDGTIKYAENPPKKYQDIYNLNWNTDDWQASGTRC